MISLSIQFKTGNTMDYIRRASERGQVDLGWLHSQHSFSFGHYYDAAHMGFSVLRVINDDIVQPGYGFGEHGHRDMEIISYVVSGRLAHKDSAGNAHELPVGDIQRMSAGKGIRHSEFNASDVETVNFLQIWIKPVSLGGAPSYEQKTIPSAQQLTPLVTQNGGGGTLSINQDVIMSRLTLRENETFDISTNQRWGYLHLIKGQLTVNDKTFDAGDAFGLKQERAVQVLAKGDVEALWFDLPPEH